MRPDKKRRYYRLSKAKEETQQFSEPILHTVGKRNRPSNRMADRTPARPGSTQDALALNVTIYRTPARPGSTQDALALNATIYRTPARPGSTQDALALNATIYRTPARPTSIQDALLYLPWNSLSQFTTYLSLSLTSQRSAQSPKSLCLQKRMKIPPLDYTSISSFNSFAKLFENKQTTFV